jgi:Co/Zn/Cd efflux system component
LGCWCSSRPYSVSSILPAGAFQHILTDLYGFIGTAIAGVVVITTGWRRADPIASLVVVVLVLRAAWGLLRASGHVLSEGTPETVDLDGTSLSGLRAITLSCTRGSTWF